MCKVRIFVRVCMHMCSCSGAELPSTLLRVGGRQCLVNFPLSSTPCRPTPAAGYPRWKWGHNPCHQVHNFGDNIDFHLHMRTLQRLGSGIQNPSILHVDEKGFPSILLQAWGKPVNNQSLCMCACASTVYVCMCACMCHDTPV